MAWSQTDFECLLVEENFILLICADKVRLLKLQDMDHERDIDQPSPTPTHYVTHSANKQTKEELAYVMRNRSLEDSLQHASVYYFAERLLQGCLKGSE